MPWIPPNVMVTKRKMHSEVLFLKTNTYHIILLALLFISFSSCAPEVIHNYDLTPFSIIDKPPEPIKEFPPYYRLGNVNKIVTGKVVARFTITKEGKTDNSCIVESNPPGYFDKAVLSAIKKYKYSPALKDGEPVNVCMYKTFMFDPYD